MTSIDLAVARLRTEEGFRQFAYKDTVGKLTIGYGFNIDAGFDKELCDVILAFLARRLDTQLAAYDWYANLDDTRKSVFLDMGYNLGLDGLLHFTQTISAVSRADWPAASQRLLASKAATQLPKRYQALANILETGVIA